MSLHADVMLMKVNDEILKQTYFTTAYRCDQGIEDSLSIAEHVLKCFAIDQCDREAALARNAICKYVDEGNNLISANDIRKALCTSNLINTKVSVVSFNNGLLTGAKIDKISSYHSYEISESNSITENKIRWEQ